MKMDRPNVILMICHDLGRHLGCYGVETVDSPNIDRLAAESVLFTNNFCTAPQCSPSRSSMMTGRYPHSNGILGLTHAQFAWRYNEGETHIAQRFKEAGYRTVLSFSQHVTNDAESIGFDEALEWAPAPENGDQAARVIASHDPAASGPLYMQAGFFEPHRPWSGHGITPDDSKGVAVPGYLPDIPEAREEFAQLQGAIRQLDIGVGRILDAVDASPLRDNTIVIFTTDHGIAMPRAKCTLYDPGIGTAFIVRVPDCGAGVRDELVSNVDVTPTLLELAGLPPAENAHGVSLAPLLRGEQFTPHEEIFAELTFHTAYTPTRAIRTKKWKLVRNLEHAWQLFVPTDVRRGPIWGAIAKDYCGSRPYAELYDLEADPFEKNNLAAEAEHAPVVKDLTARLARWMRETNDPLLEGPPRSPYYEEALRQLAEAEAEGRG